MSHLSLEQFAITQARLDSGDPEDAVFSAVQLTAEGWAESQRRYADALSTEADQGGNELNTRFREAYNRAWRAKTTDVVAATSASAQLSAAAPPPPASTPSGPFAQPTYQNPVGIPPAAPLHVATAPAPPLAAAAVSQPRPLAQATYQKVAAAAQAPAPAVVPPQMPPAHVAVAAAAAPLPAVSKPPAHLAGTAFVDNAAAAKPATPFVQGEFKPPAAASPVSVSRPFTGTAFADQSTFTGRATPFEKREVRPPQPPAPPPPRQVAPATPVAGTAFMNDELAAAVRSVRPLPFREGQAQLPTKQEPAPASIRSGTAFLPEAAAPPSARSPATPFVPQGGPLPPLKDYVRITAILRKEGNSEATFRKLGVDPAAWAVTVRDYNAKLATDPMLHGLYNQLLQRALSGGG